MSLRPSPLARRVLFGLAALVVSAAVSLLATGAFTSNSARQSSEPLPRALHAPTSRRPVTFSPSAAVARLPRDTNVVARARRGSVPVFRRAGDRRPYRRVNARRVGGRRVPLVFLVRSRRPGWVRAYLPVRPNRQTAWVRARDVSLAQNPYRIRIELRRHRLLVFRGARRIAREPIGTGKALSPTPLGHYYVTDLVKPPNPNGFYGPFALGLSAFSPVYTTFEGGDGQVGIHGTNNPSLIGRDVSHGCIRVNNRIITRLARLLPLGTPVDIAR